MILTEDEIDELSRTMVKGSKSVNWLSRAIEAAILAKIGEPVAYSFVDDPKYFAMPGFGYSENYPDTAINVTPLYKLPEVTK